MGHQVEAGPERVRYHVPRPQPNKMITRPDQIHRLPDRPVHHANQRSEVSDVFEKVSGTSGLIGVVDSLLLLQRRRGDDVGTLSVSGREVEDQTIALG
jgi:hypothetical protein